MRLEPRNLEGIKKRMEPKVVKTEIYIEGIWDIKPFSIFIFPLGSSPVISRFLGLPPINILMDGDWRESN